MQSIQRYSFPHNRFYGTCSSQRQPANTDTNDLTTRCLHRDNPPLLEFTQLELTKA